MGNCFCPLAKPRLTSVFPVDKLGHHGLVLVLFETPSGFAIFKFDGVQLFLPKAKEVLTLFFLLIFQLILPCHWLNFLDFMSPAEYLGQLCQGLYGRGCQYTFLSLFF
jgi:hypothetical protein